MTSHGNADAVCRRPCRENCKHCSNAEKKFGIETDNSVKILTSTSVDPGLHDGVLYRRWENDDGRSCRWQLILSKSRIPEVLRETHDSASGRHFGVMKTLSKTREQFYWDRLRADVEKWCKECHACGARKGPKTRSEGRLQRCNVDAPFERMTLDILGPFPVTTKGNRYVLVLMDYFTECPEAIPIPDQEVSIVAEELVRS
ncbi:hypothetical protein AVEN_15868-1 [Araneus ventricosus]|uniref:Integrase zinc-binding domain-containing protein n=1 Tax=Araneus ventricosus TaxID=182803 RepID=A0A4Y2W0K2_ARAVE|nr:hypothetical protein AVEN_15868-1 [Araneus ventricosus]